MRVLNLLFVLSTLLFLAACGGETSGSSGTETDTTTIDSSGLADTTAGSTMDRSAGQPAHNCTISSEVLEGNQFWAAERRLLVVITADSTTMDEEFGASHRILEIYDTETCQRIQREVLPVNVSPDFPYFIAGDLYSADRELVGIQGANTIYIYDVVNKKLLPELKPKFLSERLSEDAQSGNILRLEVWENYLFGFAEDKGIFVFDLRQAGSPSALLPVAEFKSGENQFVSLFGLSAAAGNTQLALPDFNRDLEEFSINPLLDSPQNINLSIQANARNNRFIVLRRNDAGRTAIAIDLQNRKMLDLPADVASQPTQAVLQWARSQ